MDQWQLDLKKNNLFPPPYFPLLLPQTNIKPVTPFQVKQTKKRKDTCKIPRETIFQGKREERDGWKTAAVMVINVHFQDAPIFPDLGKKRGNCRSIVFSVIFMALILDTCSVALWAWAKYQQTNLLPHSSRIFSLKMLPANLILSFLNLFFFPGSLPSLDLSSAHSPFIF